MSKNIGFQNKVEQLSQKGNSYYENNKYGSALHEYTKALELIPDSKNEKSASTWLYTSIADCYYCLGDLSLAKENYYNALNCPDGFSNGYINLSLGITLYELEAYEEAKEFLLIAYMLEGDGIFEDENPKYMEHIKSLV